MPLAKLCASPTEGWKFQEDSDQDYRCGGAPAPAPPSLEAPPKQLRNSPFFAILLAKITSAIRR